MAEGQPSPMPLMGEGEGPLNAGEPFPPEGVSGEPVTSHLPNEATPGEPSMPHTEFAPAAPPAEFAPAAPPPEGKKTFFLTHNDVNVKVVGVCNTFEELFNIFLEKYPDVRAARENVLFEIEDREFRKMHKLETPEEIYHGATVGVRLREAKRESEDAKRKLDAAPHDSAEPSGKRQKVDEVVPSYIDLPSSSKADSAVSAVSPRPYSSRPSDVKDDGHHVIKLRGLPWECTEEQLREFFKPIEIADGKIVFVDNNVGRRTGEAYIKFGSPEDNDAALKKDGNYVGRRYVEVYQASLADWTHALERAEQPKHDAHAPESKSGSGAAVARLRGLPYSATREDVRRFLKDLETVDVHLTTDYMGRPSGEAYVELASEELASQLRSQFHGKTFLDSRRYVEVFSSTPGELQNVLQGQGGGGGGYRSSYGGSYGSSYGGSYGGYRGGYSSYRSDYYSRPPSSYGGYYPPSRDYYAPRDPYYSSPAPRSFHSREAAAESSCIKMQGLPFSSTDADITAFFQDVNIAPTRIVRSSAGEAYVDFGSSQAATQALGKHKSFMGSRYVDLFKVPSAEMYDPAKTSRSGYPPHGGAAPVYDARDAYPPAAPSSYAQSPYTPSHASYSPYAAAPQSGYYGRGY